MNEQAIKAAICRKLAKQPSTFLEIFESFHSCYQERVLDVLTSLYKQGHLSGGTVSRASLEVYPWSNLHSKEEIARAVLKALKGQIADAKYTNISNEIFEKISAI